MKPYTQTITGTKVRYDMMPIRAGQISINGRLVNLSAFWMGKHEVTWDEYDLWARQPDRLSGYKKPALKADQRADAVSWPSPPYHQTDHNMGHSGYPAIGISQFAARQYTRWLSMKTGHFYRLPTEAEWEYACRAGTKTRYSFGDAQTPLKEFGWYESNAEDQYHKVGSLKPNPWGLHDMHGNVAEWVLDGLHKNRYAKYPAGKILDNPIDWPTQRFGRVVRGGSWLDEAADLTSASRGRSAPHWNAGDGSFPKSIWWLRDASWVGFRVVRPLNPPPRDQWHKYWDPDLELEREIYDEQRQLRDQDIEK